MDQLCIAGKNRNYLILADASPDLKLFLNPCGLVRKNQTDQAESQPNSWRCQLIPGGHRDVILDLTVSVCGEWIASGSKDQSICLWHLIENNDELNDRVRSVMKTKVELVVCLENAHSSHVTSLCFDK